MATVMLVSPSGNPEVWPKDAVQEKLGAGYITLEAWQAQGEAEAQAKHQAWINDPATAEERFASLRQIRDSRIAATDYLLAADYPVSPEKLAAVKAYRQALRDLPAQEGAPWDGGGPQTPWPQAPAIIAI